MKRKILVIEDSSGVIDQIKRQESDLIAYHFFELPAYKDYPELFSIFEKKLLENSFDAALLDYELWGDLIGTDLIPTLKRNLIPFIGFSSNPMHNQIFNHKGAKAVILKNFDIGNLTEQLVKILE